MQTENVGCMGWDLERARLPHGSSRAARSGAGCEPCGVDLLAPPAGVAPADLVVMQDVEIVLVRVAVDDARLEPELPEHVRQADLVAHAAAIDLGPPSLVHLSDHGVGGPPCDHHGGDESPMAREAGAAVTPDLVEQLGALVEALAVHLTRLVVDAVPLVMRHGGH